MSISSITTPPLWDNSTLNATGTYSTTFFESTHSAEYLEWEKYYIKNSKLYHAGAGVAVAIICIIGFIANILSITVLSMILRRSKLPVYRCFLGLAIADFLGVTLLLISFGTYYLNPKRILVDDYDKNLASNKSLSYNIIIVLLPYANNVAFCASNWCVVTMSSLRCIAVFKPLWYQRFCTPKIVNILLVGVYICSVLIVIPDMIFTRYSKESMRFYIDEEKQAKISQLFNPRVFTLFLIQLLPLLATTGLLIPLIWKLCTHSSIERSASNAEYRNRDRVQTTVTLVCISAFFIICVTPDIVYYGMAYLSPKQNGTSYPKIHNTVKYFVAKSILLSINYTANFFFYVLLNARLRRKLKLVIKCTSEGNSDRRLACITQQSSLSGGVVHSHPGEKGNGSSPNNNNTGWSKRTQPTNGRVNGGCRMSSSHTVSSSSLRSIQREWL